MNALEPALPLVLAAAAMLAGGDHGGWLLLAAAALVLVIGRWEAYVLSLPGAAAVGAGLAAEGRRWHLVVASVVVVAGAALVLNRRLPDTPIHGPRTLALIPGAVLVVAAGWTPGLDLQSLEAYREGAVLAAAGAALALAAVMSTAALRARSGKMEDPASAGSAENGA